MGSRGRHCEQGARQRRARRLGHGAGQRDVGNAVAAQQVAAAFVFGLYFYALCTVFVVSISSLSTRAEFRDESLLVLLDAAQAFVFRVESLKFLASFREQLSFVLRAAPWYELS